MTERITDDDLDLLNELGVDTSHAATGGRSAREQRIIAGFEEIERFVEQQGRLPEHGAERDIFERLYAVRLDCARASEECRAVLQAFDGRGLLTAGDASPMNFSAEPSDAALLASLGVEPTADSDVGRLVHVRAREEINAAEEVARRIPCQDFETFRPIFARVQQELESGARKTVKYKERAEIAQGDFFILDGQKTVVAEMGEEFISDYGRPDRRLRVVFDNGTESDLLARSLQRALYKDKTSRRITEAGSYPLFSEEAEAGDLASGYVYVLRSKSDHPFVVENRLVLHKIGVTGGEVKARVANAKKDPTYLLAEVEVVATFKLANIDRKAFESLLHKFFGSARLDLELKDRFGSQVEPREWFLVPLPAIDEAIQKLKAGSIGDFRYDRHTASLVPA
jgi:hypothetical protein